MANLTAMDHLMAGKHFGEDEDGYGIYDALADMDNLPNEELSSEFSQAFDDLINSVETLASPLSEVVVDDPSVAETIFNNFQKTIAYLKVDVASALSIGINYTDNDGD